MKRVSLQSLIKEIGGCALFFKAPESPASCFIYFLSGQLGHDRHQPLLIKSPILYLVKLLLSPMIPD